MDPQTGEIQRYDLQHVPAWVDRVYSANMAKNMLNWWGEWKTVPWNIQGSGGRYQVDGDVTLVYTTHGPAWQALMTSQNSDSGVNYVALMDTRSNKVVLYDAPKGMNTQDKVQSAIASSKNNLKSLEPSGLALHQIYGQLVWVAPLVPTGTPGDQAESFAGLAMLTATDPNSADVIIGTDKGSALTQLSAQIATGSDNAAPSATSNVKKVAGVVSNVTQVVEDGQSSIVLTLKGDTSHIYEIKVSADVGSLAAALAKVGDKVTIGYVDTGSPIRNIGSYSTSAFSPGK